MRFNIKSAVKYSSALKNIIEQVESSLRVNETLINRYASTDDITNIPAITTGLYKATITHQKTKVNNEVGKNLTDEIVNIEANSEFEKILPETRLKILSDLIAERAKIDYEIEKIKNGSTIKDEFSGTELTYDLGCQINAMYRRYVDNVLKPLVDMEKNLLTTTNGKTTIVTTIGDQAVSSNVTYPIEIKAESLVNSSDVLKMKEDIENKCALNSDKLSEIQISKYFEYEPKFNLNPSIRSLVEQYSK